MKLILSELMIENFKGISRLDLKFESKITLITGANGTCKSTIADAFFWLMDNSNTDQRSNFNLIPLDENGAARDHISPTVTAIVQVDGQQVELKKTYRQVWTKRRGSENEELSGHTTDYFYDEVPVSKKDYHNRLNELMHPVTFHQFSDIFRSVADIRYFCGTAGYQYRRQALMELIGAVTDQDIIAQHEDLKELIDILHGRTMDDYKTVLAQNRKAINEQLSQIPVRIDERKTERPDTTGLEADDLTERMTEVDNAISKKMAEIAGLSSAGLLAEKKREILDLENEAKDKEGRIRSKYDDQRRSISAMIEKMEREISRKQTELYTQRQRVSQVETEIASNAGLRAELVKEYEAANAMMFSPRTTCYACGQELSTDKLDQQFASFNVEKAEKLRRINAQGGKLFKQFKEMEADREERKKNIVSIDTGIRELEKDLAAAHEKLAESEKAMDKEITDKTEGIRGRIDAISKDLEKSDIDIAPERDRLKNELSDLEAIKGHIESDMMKLTLAEKIDRRVKELTLLLKEHGAAYERNLYELHLIEQFQRKKAEYIESSVSRFFTVTDWKLFEEQINGGYRDICEAVHEGIPYSTDLNTGARINVGLDVVNTLGKHYGVVCPIFVDNAESVTNWMQTIDNQQIRLIAMEGKGLEVIHG